MIKSNYYIYCPHCGEEITIYKDELDPAIDMFDIKCDRCKNDIRIEVEYKPIFQTEKLYKGYCMECNEELMYVNKPLTEKDKVRKYADVPNEQYCLCHNCETKLKFDDAVGNQFQFTMRKKK